MSSTSQHGESGAALPRQIAKQIGRVVCDTHNSRQPRRYPGGNLFTVPDPDAMKNVTVEHRPKQRVLKKPK